MKICTGCQNEKDLECFAINKASKDGRHSRCKQCRKDQNKALRNGYEWNPALAATRVCPACKENLPLEAFYPGKATRQGTSSYCKGCQSDYMRWNKIQKNYGLTREQYEELLKAQNGVCAICGEIDEDKPLHVDHDHKCCPGAQTCGNCVRALLCQGCNTTLGHMGDSPERLMAAAAYLVQFENVLRADI